ncbi:MAG TPA: prepilin-type N-terminal cleavage/methylation domain-containing protein [Candidatus Paceibacterota bacterium]|nr:prepilin-type N-terminal cleavage/methylation domain-containing protein [Candidatus Paceibacterota bacterium]
MNTHQTQRGYTLLEMMVSIGLFSLVMLLTTAAFLKLISLDRIARGTNDVVNNLSFAIDTMERSIRTGRNYQCGGPGGSNCWTPQSPGSALTFTDENGRTITFLRKRDGTIGRCAFASGVSTTCTIDNAVSLTDPRITIETMSFYVRGVGTAPPNDTVQPQVIFTLSGYMRPDANSDTVDFTIQSQATQRLIEL